MPGPLDQVKTAILYVHSGIDCLIYPFLTCVVLLDKTTSMFPHLVRVPTLYVSEPEILTQSILQEFSSTSTSPSSVQKSGPSGGDASLLCLFCSSGTDMSR